MHCYRWAVGDEVNKHGYVVYWNSVCFALLLGWNISLLYPTRVFTRFTCSLYSCIFALTFILEKSGRRTCTLIGSGDPASWHKHRTRYLWTAGDLFVTRPDHRLFLDFSYFAWVPLGKCHALCVATGTSVHRHLTALHLSQVLCLQYIIQKTDGHTSIPQVRFELTILVLGP